jgi:hypothetical protein
MSQARFRPGVRVLRTGPDLPHLGVQAGRVYEVEAFDADSDEGLFIKNVLAGLNPAAFSPVED